MALWNAENEGECEEITAADGTTVLTLTADESGTPFTVTSTSSAGSFTSANTTANVSPNDLNNGTNWSNSSTVPAAGDDVIIDAGGDNESIWWNLGALSAVTVATFTRRRGFTGRIGLDEYNTDNQDSYFEYRATELALGMTSMLIEQPASDGTGQLKFNGGSVQTALTILGDGPSAIGSEQCWWRGTHASNIVNVSNGSLAVAPVIGSSAVIATLRAENSTVRLGQGCTLTTVTSVASTVEINSSVTTFTQNESTATLYAKKAAAITTLTLNGGTLVWQSSGTITTLTPGPGVTMDFSQGSGAVTITNQVTFQAGTIFNDPEGRVTFSGGWKLGPGVKLTDCPGLNFGPGRTYSVS